MCDAWRCRTPPALTLSDSKNIDSDETVERLSAPHFVTLQVSPSGCSIVSAMFIHTVDQVRLHEWMATLVGRLI